MRDNDEIICRSCIGDPFLSAEILETGVTKKCSYCGKRKKSFSIDDITERVEDIITKYFVRTPEDSEYGIPGWERERDGDNIVDILGDVLSVERKIAEDIQAILKAKYYDHENAEMSIESEFADDAQYEFHVSTKNHYSNKWAKFEQSIRHEARYFNPKAKAYLRKVFENVHEYSAYKKEDIITLDGPGTSLQTLYRARMFQNESDLRLALIQPDELLGTPSTDASKAGRMNAKGIPVFYGSTAVETALAEVRPAVGSKVAVSEFEITRPLRLLNLGAFKRLVDPASYFDPQFLENYLRISFLRELIQRIATPVLPNDQEYEYLSTQFIADFLATNRKLAVDGLIFPSTQVKDDSQNIVLFNKAAKVFINKISDDAQVRVDPVYDSPDYYRSYSVTIVKSSNTVYTPKKSIDNKMVDRRKISLKIKEDTIVIHHITAAQYHSESHTVTRSIFNEDEIRDE